VVVRLRFHSYKSNYFCVVCVCVTVPIRREGRLLIIIKQRSAPLPWRDEK
jgi:hypothetical protein